MRVSTIIVALFATAQAIRLKEDDATKQLIGLGQKLGLETTADMFEGQSPEDVSNAIIGAALEAGKTQEEIEAVMSGKAWKFWKHCKVDRYLSDSNKYL